MPTAQHVLEEAEEHFDGPAVAIDQRDDPGGQVKQVRGDQQQSVAGRAGCPAPFFMGRGFHPDQSHRMIGTVFGAVVLAETDDRVQHDARFDVFGGQGSILLDLVATIVAQPANIAAVGGHNRVEQSEFRVAAIRHIALALVQRPSEYGTFVGLAACAAFRQVDAHGHTVGPIELRVQTPLRLGFRRPRIAHRGLGEHGQALQECAVDERQCVSDVLQPWIAGHRFELRAQFGDDLLQSLRLEDVGGFTERTQRSALTAEFALDFP
jgi:hypothetical protein